jgi:hypothetical protein
VERAHDVTIKNKNESRAAVSMVLYLIHKSLFCSGESSKAKI